MEFHPTVASPPSGVIAVQDGPTSIRVSWTPPSPLGDTSGYRIYYTRAGGSSDSVDVDGGNTNSRTLMGLTNGETYTISVAGRSSSSSVLPSPPEPAGDVALGKSKTIQCSVHETNHSCVSMCVGVHRFVMIVCPCYDGSSAV